MYFTPAVPSDLRQPEWRKAYPASELWRARKPTLSATLAGSCAFGHVKVHYEAPGSEFGTADDERFSLLGVIRKTAFWDKHRDTPVNERQRKVLNMLFDGFDGKLTSSKWYKINHCSQDTANRDINDLIAKGILRSTVEGGRSTAYELCEF